MGTCSRRIQSHRNLGIWGTWRGHNVLEGSRGHGNLGHCNGDLQSQRDTWGPRVHRGAVMGT